MPAEHVEAGVQVHRELALRCALYYLGAKVGWLWEKMYSPNLKGANPESQLRPVYGVGCMFASSNYLENLLLAIYIEQLAGELWPYAWSYTGKADAITDKVRLSYAFEFATLMTRLGRACHLGSVADLIDKNPKL